MKRESRARPQYPDAPDSEIAATSMISQARGVPRLMPMSGALHRVPCDEAQADSARIRHVPEIRRHEILAMAILLG